MCIVSKSENTHNSLLPPASQPPIPSTHLPHLHHPLALSIISESHQLSTDSSSTMGVLPLGPIVPGHFSYYFIFSSILLCVWLFRPTSKRPEVDVPLYKASRRKWMFEADTLVRDSYSKVSIILSREGASVSTYANRSISSRIASTRSGLPRVLGF